LLPVNMLLLATLLLGQSPQTPHAPFTDYPQQDAIEYRVALTVDMDHATLKGSVDYTFAAVEPLATITLDARHSAEWHVTFTDEHDKAMPAAWGEDSVVLTLPAPLAKGEQIHFRAALAGKPIDGFYFTANRYRELMAFTDHYSMRARGWLPCEDHPADRARFALHLVYPANEAVVASGAPVAKVGTQFPAPPDGYAAVDYATTAEIPPYMFAIVVGPLARVHEDGDPRLVDHFVYQRDVEKAKRGLVHDGQWLQTMEKTFGPYLFQKYTTIQCPTRWGGFEAPGNVLLAENLFDGKEHGTGTLAHELVHMWFGDGIGYATWRDVWLSEGFASYFGPWLESQAGGPSLRDSLERMRASWAASPEGRTKSIRDEHFTTPDEILNANTYPKGAWVLHMLRGELGDEKFFAALRAYYTQFAGKAVHNDDFTRAVAKSTGVDLGWFFAQWLDRVGCPELKVAAGDGAISVTQGPGEPWRCWLRLRWLDDKGDKHEQRVRVAAAKAEVPAAGGIKDLQVDPDVELLFRPLK
jgi:aminopeptidase N